MQGQLNDYNNYAHAILGVPTSGADGMSVSVPLSSTLNPQLTSSMTHPMLVNVLDAQGNPTHGTQVLINPDGTPLDLSGGSVEGQDKAVMSGVDAMAFPGSMVQMGNLEGGTGAAQGASDKLKRPGGGKRCLAQGCDKSAQGNTDFCKKHGGGKRCSEDGCNKSAEGTTDKCKKHGGGKRCSYIFPETNEKCQKSACGTSGFCIAHGGGKVCQHAGCTKSARGPSGLCIAHGGGKRCDFIDANGVKCTKSAKGTAGKCIAHGGGTRCTFVVSGPGPNGEPPQVCGKAAWGSKAFCVAHGGGKRCQHEGCTKLAVDKSMRCKAHGGGRRCGYAGCTKSAQGKTNFCIAHGGGRRCTHPNCGKSAKGLTGLCIAHSREAGEAGKMPPQQPDPTALQNVAAMVALQVNGAGQAIPGFDPSSMLPGVLVNPPPGLPNGVTLMNSGMMMDASGPPGGVGPPHMPAMGAGVLVTPSQAMGTGAGAPHLPTLAPTTTEMVSNPPPASLVDQFMAVNPVHHEVPTMAGEEGEGHPAAKRRRVEEGVAIGEGVGEGELGVELGPPV